MSTGNADWFNSDTISVELFSIEKWIIDKSSESIELHILEALSKGGFDDRIFKI